MGVIKENQKVLDDTVVRFEVSDKLPHTGKMLLIDGIAYKENERVKLSVTVPPDTIFLSPDGVLAPLAMVEMIAQLCGAQHSFDQNLEKGRLCGYLVGIDNVAFTQPVYASNQLDLVAWKVLEMEDIKRVKGEVLRDGQKVGQAELTLYKTDGWMSQPEMANHPGPPINTVDQEYIGWANKKDPVSKETVESIHQIEISHKQSVEATFCFKPEFVGFAGHFPGHAVLPGVAMINIGLLLAEMCGGKKLDLGFVKRAKFAGPIYPNDKVHAVLKRIDNDKKNNQQEQGSQYSLVIKNRGNLVCRCTIGTIPALVSVGK